MLFRSLNMWKKFPDFLLWEIWIENSSQHEVASSQHHAWCKLTVYISIASIYSAQLSTDDRGMSVLKKKFHITVPVANWSPSLTVRICDRVESSFRWHLQYEIFLLERTATLLSHLEPISSIVHLTIKHSPVTFHLSCFILAASCNSQQAHPALMLSCFQHVAIKNHLMDADIVN